MRQLFPTQSPIDGRSDLEALYALPASRHVRANFISSIDGAIELDGLSRTLGGPADRDAFMSLRAVSDVVLVGAGTARAEGYGPIRLDDAAKGRRVERGLEPLPGLAIVSARGELDPQASIFAATERPIIITTASAAAARPDLAEIADVVVCGDDRVDLKDMLDALSERGLMRVLCEGGPALLESLLVDHLVDELCLTLSPVIAGSGHRSLTGDHPLVQAIKFELAGLIEGDGMLLTRYRRANRE
jgi:riboflavin biosynthesis pyrimidine reductase